MELQLIYEGNGRFRTASKIDLGIANAEFGHGEVLVFKPTKKRSIRQHNWFFSMVQKAFDNQSAGPTFDDSEHLRKWLLVQIGHCEVRQWDDPRAITPSVVQFLRQEAAHVFWSHDSRRIYARKALSVSFRAVDGAEMTDIANRVVDVIMAEVVPGTTRADWEPYLKEGRQKAARRAKTTAAKEMGSAHV